MKSRKENPSIEKQFQRVADIAQRMGYGHVIYALLNSYKTGECPFDDFDSLKDDTLDLICKIEHKFGTEYLKKKPKDALQKQVQKIMKKYF